MNKFKKIVLIVFFTLGTIIINAQQKLPVMSFSKIEHDFGKIRQEDGVAKAVFEFVNTGSAPLIITDVKTSCGCTTPSYSRQPIPPGGKGYIEAAYDPVNSPGPFSKTITVSSNAQNSPIVLTIKGVVAERQSSIEEKYPFVVDKLRLTNNFVNFGNIYSNEKKSQTIGIYNNTNETLELDFDANITSRFLKAQFEPKTLKKNQEGKLTITFDASQANEWDFVRGMLFLKINNQTIDRFPIQISAIIKEFFTEEQLKNAPKIEFSELSYEFDTVNEGQIVEKVFKFKNTGKGDLIIRKTTTSCGCTAVNVNTGPIKPGEEGEIKVIFNTDYKPNYQIKTITVITNCPEPYNKVLLKISGFVRPKK